MTVYIFLGPSLAAADAEAGLDAVFLPPVSQGDVYRATVKRPEAIGIVDGYFEHVPAVWHKEILWAISEGIPVYGSASMGALRAAELAAFGMHGVGRIFEAFHNGTLEDDDEVAVAHADAENGYRALSEAMISIRITLDAAHNDAVIDVPARRMLIEIAKQLHYPNRSYPAVLRAAEARGLPTSTGERLRSWLPTGKIDQKAADAKAMLSLMATRPWETAPLQRTAFNFERTAVWEESRRSILSDSSSSAELARGVILERLLDELRLLGPVYGGVIQGAAMRRLALDAAPHLGVAPQTDPAETAEFRHRHGLESDEAFAHWLHSNDISADDFARLMMEESTVKRIIVRLWDEVRAQIADYLRTIGSYAELAAAARAKERALESVGLARCGLEHVDGGLNELLRWFYYDYLRHRPAWTAGYPPSIPRSTEDAAAFARAALREYLQSTSATHAETQIGSE